MPESGTETSRDILDTQNIKISGYVDREHFEQGSQILTYPHFCTFAAVTLTECTAHSKIILASTSKQISCIIVFQMRQKLWVNSWNFWGFPLVFPSLYISHSKPGIPFTSGQKGI